MSLSEASLGESWAKKNPKIWDIYVFKWREQAEAGGTKPVTEAGHKHLSISHILDLPFPCSPFFPHPGSNHNRIGLKLVVL